MIKSRKSKIFGKVETSKKFPTEPKVMEELHKIREEMSKMTKEEFHESLKKASEEFKDLVK
jgi:hypothetical protein